MPTDRSLCSSRIEYRGCAPATVFGSGNLGSLARCGLRDREPINVRDGRFELLHGIAAIGEHSGIPLSIRRSSGGQHDYVRQLWTRDGDADKNANRWENGQIRTERDVDRQCSGFDLRLEAGLSAGCAKRGRMRAHL